MDLRVGFPEPWRRICHLFCRFTSYFYPIIECQGMQSKEACSTPLYAPSINKHEDAMLRVNVEASLCPCSGPFLILLSYLHICRYRRLRQSFHRSCHHVSLTRSHYDHCVQRCHGGDWYCY